MIAVDQNKNEDGNAKTNEQRGHDCAELWLAQHKFKAFEPLHVWMASTWEEITSSSVITPTSL
jgi:hypothetical protein